MLIVAARRTDSQPAMPPACSSRVACLRILACTGPRARRPRFPSPDPGDVGRRVAAQVHETRPLYRTDGAALDGRARPASCESRNTALRHFLDAGQGHKIAVGSCAYRSRKRNPERHRIKPHHSPSRGTSPEAAAQIWSRTAYRRTAASRRTTLIFARVQDICGRSRTPREDSVDAPFSAEIPGRVSMLQSRTAHNPG